MFYFDEFILRFKYIFLSFFITIICFFNYKEILVPLLSLSLLNNSDVFGSFIFTHPAELLRVQLYIIIILSILFSIPYLIWNLFEFIKSGLFKNEYVNLKNLILSFLLFFYLSNFLINFILFPKIWLFFENFNLSNNNIKLLSFSFELRIEEYLKFLIDFTYIVNSFLILFFVILFVILKFGISNLLKWKKLFILLNIVFATLLSPPDVYSQLIILFFFSIILEITVLFYIYILKINKSYYQN